MIGPHSAPSSISVVVPTYNGAEFVTETLASVFGQTVPPFEIIVVDDRSKDDTVARVGKLLERSPVPARLIELPANSGGPARPLNRGIAEARGDLVAFVEQDDLMRPDRLEWQARAFAQFPESGLAMGRFVIIGRADESLSPMWGDISQFDGVVDDIAQQPEVFLLSQERAFRGLLDRNFAGSNSGLCVRREVLDLVGGFSERHQRCTDLDLALRVSAHTSFAVVNRVIFEYRWRDESLFRTSVERALGDTMTVRADWTIRRPDLAGPAYWRVYWSLRASATRALGRRQYRLARVLWGLVLRHPASATLLKRRASKLIRRDVQ